MEMQREQVLLEKAQKRLEEIHKIPALKKGNSITKA